MAEHTFSPTTYHNTIGPHEPVLRIAGGDTVHTTTVDAAGRDAGGRLVTQPSNPMTGPFYVEGAEPGDTLAVTFVDMRPAGRVGYSRTVVAEHVVDAAFVRELPEQGEVEWLLPDGRGASVGRLAALHTISREEDLGQIHWQGHAASLARWQLPLAPMLGCFGVAPARRQAISTGTSGPYGGNMDYRGFTRGVTVCLPVSLPGALFFLGDGHAAQGDGEIVGTGIEAAFAVTFSVEVRKNWAIGWPRGESEDYIFTVGNARPLDQAVQHATTEMLRWLRADYGLDLRSAGILLGQCVEYDLGNIFDPAYTMVCKVPKAVLAAVSG